MTSAAAGRGSTTSVTRPEPGRRPGGRLWFWVAVAHIAVFLAGLGYWMFQVEIPYIDSFRGLDYVLRRSWLGLLTDYFHGTAEYRPIYFTMLKAVLAVGGPSVTWIRLVQMALVALYCWTFFRLVQPSDAAGHVGFATGFGCLTGLHTARFTVSGEPLLSGWSLIVGLLVFTTLSAMHRRSSLGLNVAAVALTVAGVFMVEVGVVVGFIWIAAGLLRWGGATRRTAALATAALAGYVAIRLFTNQSPVPGPFYTDSGFGFDELTVGEQRERFGAHPWVLHLYNMTTGPLSVLLSEPRDGVYVGARALVRGETMYPWQVVNWTSSIASTALLGWWLVRAGLMEHRTRRLATCTGIVFLTTGLLDYLYARDRIAGVAGACYALLLAHACRYWWERAQGIRMPPVRAACSIALVALACTWTVRSFDTVVLARDLTLETKREWTDRFHEITTPPYAGAPPDDERTDALRERLHQRAIDRQLPDLARDPPWLAAWFERQE